MVSPSETISFACPRCGTHLSVPVHLAGVTGPCPTCQSQISAPTRAAAPAQPPAQDPTAQQQPAADPHQSPGHAPHQQQQPASSVPQPPLPPISIPSPAQPAASPGPSQPSQPSQSPMGPASLPPLPGQQSATPPSAAHSSMNSPRATLSTGSPSQPSPGRSPETSHRDRDPSPDTNEVREDLRNKFNRASLGKAPESSPRRRSRQQRSPSSKKSSSRVPSGNALKLAGGFAIAALVVGGIFAAPNLLDSWKEKQDQAPETARFGEATPAPDPVPNESESVAPGTRVSADPGTKGTTASRTQDDASPSSDPLERPLVDDTEITLDDEPEPSLAEEEALPAPVSEGILDEPRQFLQSYLTSPNWEDLVPKSLNHEVIRPEMAAYYKANPYEPEKIVEITFRHKQSLPGSDYQFYLFKVVTESNTGSFPMTVEETAGGFRTDWQAYVQFKDAHLQHFLDNPEIGADGKGEPKTFNVILRRAHDFTGEVPDTENKWCYKVDAPVDDLMGGFCFIPKFSKFGQKLNAELKWLLLYFPIVELRWEIDPAHPDKPYVRLLKIQQFNWRGHDPGSASLESLTDASSS